ncbi:MAG: serine hydrolase, partial [Algicola sp.]|nr:serine hydrolase [Algicola sp.]
ALGVGNINAEFLEQISEPTFGKPAGGYTWSTTSALVKMGQFLMDGNTDVLPDELQQKLTQSHIGLEMGLPTGYGYGVFVSEGLFRDGQWYNIPGWSHGGNTLEYTNIFWVLPQQNVVISIMSSGYSTNFGETLVEAIKSVVEFPAASENPMPPVDTALFEKHVGDYELDSSLVHITEQDNVLNIEIPDLDAEGTQYSRFLNGVAGSHFIFSADGQEIGLTFFADETDGLSNYIRNRSFVAIRKDSGGFKSNAKQPISFKEPLKIIKDPSYLD